MKLVPALLLAACGGGSTPGGTGELGLNDVSILAPLPGLGAMGDRIPQPVFQRLVVDHGDVFDPAATFQLVAVRFDLCDRTQPGACAASADGRLRIVYQPILSDGKANDVALHAFYPIPSAELPALADDLRALAAIGGTSPEAPLGVSPPLAFDTADYKSSLLELVDRYAKGDSLSRLTLFAQDAMSSAIVWAFRGVERDGDTFVDISIPDVDVVQQRVVLTGADTTYNTSPVADAPAGFMLALAGERFGMASANERSRALEALAEIQNPMTHGADTVQCASCHVSTILTSLRASAAGVDPGQVRGTYTSSFPLATDGGISKSNERALRAFGWVRDQPAISQRVVNDTAQVLVELAGRFPSEP